MTEAAGYLECGAGHRTYASAGYVDARASDTDEVTRQTAESFGYEWTTFSEIEPEDERFWELYFKDVPLEELTDAVTLDAGCGKGRYTWFLAPHVGPLAALDGSAAVEAAAANLAARANVTVIRSDLRDIPFADASFDFICCLGVLHHLADPQAGFRALVRALAPGGRIFIYVYSRPERPSARSVGLAAASWVRSMSLRVPHKVLRAACAPAAGALYATVVVPGAVGERIGVSALAALPLATYRSKPVRSLWLDTFDRLSAPVEHRYVWTDIEPWFAAENLVVESVREQAGLFVLARRPV